MSRSPEKDAIRSETTRLRILESGFTLFARDTIDRVTMEDVARAANVGVATLYRHYKSKPALVVAIATNTWDSFVQEHPILTQADRGLTAAEDYEYYLDFFLMLYREHRDILCFNQFFNVYIRSETIDPQLLSPYRQMIGVVEERFRVIYEKALKDHTLKTDRPWRELFSETLHLMLAAVTRYAVGLAYNNGSDPERELYLLKRMLMREYVNPEAVISASEI